MCLKIVLKSARFNNNTCIYTTISRLPRCQFPNLLCILYWLPVEQMSNNKQQAKHSHLIGQCAAERQCDGGCIVGKFHLHVTANSIAKLLISTHADKAAPLGEYGCNRCANALRSCSVWPYQDSENAALSTPRRHRPWQTPTRPSTKQRPHQQQQATDADTRTSSKKWTLLDILNVL